MTRKIVITPVADMRREPDNRSERMSQTLFGHLYEVMEEREGFCYGKSEDQYPGWVNAFYLSGGEPAHEKLPQLLATSG